ncbi:K02A2.6-like [Cordylochernes scorpioides]|uniref:RNA-directed DNA polymerase n=1 Tax=Cordylochernes scorpioides TaxID=51811 RepID=A0ABY6K9N5_9ARAC|nr:K02A2.6-like [Cordylochernes scorpioides]
MADRIAELNPKAEIYKDIQDYQEYQRIKYVIPAVEIPSYLPSEKIPSGLPVNRNQLSLGCGSNCQRRPAAEDDKNSFQYKIEYIKGTSNTEADVLSRLPMFTPEQNPKEHDSEPVEMVLLMDALDSSPVTSDDIRESLPRDPALRQALDHTLQGWSEETPKEMELMPYWNYRYELGACEGLLFWGNRVIIPTNLIAKMLDELHNSHQGIVGLKSVARTLFWWPGLDKDIEETVRRCNCCQSHASMPPRTTPVNWPSTNQPWDRVHIDHLGPFEQNLYLIVVDACTKWIEAIPVPNTSTRETIKQLRCLFARFGIPRTLVSDNGTGFTSEEFRQFMTRNGIHHLRTAPFHPSSNGLAERAVQTIKTGLKKVQQGSISQHLAEILLGYRRTPIASIGKSPFEMMFGHNIRSRLDLILPNPGVSEPDINTEPEELIPQRQEVTSEPQSNQSRVPRLLHHLSSESPQEI